MQIKFEKKNIENEENAQSLTIKTQQPSIVLQLKQETKLFKYFKKQLGLQTPILSKKTDVQMNKDIKQEDFNNQSLKKSQENPIQIQTFNLSSETQLYKCFTKQLGLQKESYKNSQKALQRNDKHIDLLQQEKMGARKKFCYKKRNFLMVNQIVMSILLLLILFTLFSQYQLQAESMLMQVTQPDINSNSTDKTLQTKIYKLKLALHDRLMKVSASTIWDQNNFDYLLDNRDGTTAWSAKQNDLNQYIEAFSQKPMKIIGIITQGRQTHDTWIRKYQVSYSLNNVEYFPLHSYFNQQQFNGNYDRFTKVEHIFKTPVNAKMIRIHPTEWINHISMRFDIIVEVQE